MVWLVDENEDNTNTISELEVTPAGSPASEEGESGVLQETKQAPDAKPDEAQALQDKYLRLAAEFENYKRLAQRDQREHSRFANESILKELLPIVDNLERAIRSSKESPTPDGLIQGVELTLKQFLETLAKFGVRQVTSVGEAFDPSRHQAVAHVESKDTSENTVVEEYQRGYLLHDRILRAAMVAVANAPKTAIRDEGETPLSADEASVDAPN